MVFPTSFQIFGLTFYLYGLLVGSGVLAALLVIEWKAKQEKLCITELWSQLTFILVAAALGGRLWYVFSEGLLWTGRWQESFFFWQGGLSILGALVAAGAMSWWLNRSTGRFWQWLDVFAFGIPLGQIIGRFGNLINQELYGLPTRLPWAIPIDAAHRISGYETQGYYHPLFAYEQLLLVGFLVWQWRKVKQRKWLVGSGFYIWTYATYYVVIRILLDVLRLQKNYLIEGWLGMNQAVLLLALLGLLSWGVPHFYQTAGAKQDAS